MGPNKKASFKGGDNVEFLLDNAFSKAELWDDVSAYVKENPQIAEKFKEITDEDFNTDSQAQMQMLISDLKEEDFWPQVLELFDSCFQ